MELDQMDLNTAWADSNNENYDYMARYEKFMTEGDTVFQTHHRGAVVVPKDSQVTDFKPEQFKQIGHTKFGQLVSVLKK